MQRLSAPSCPSHSSGSGSPSSSRLDFGEQSAAVGRERGHVPRPTPWPLVDLTFLSRGASAPQFSLTADGFQIFCLSFVGKWSTELWFGSSHGKSTLPLAGDVRADLGPPFQDRGGGAEGYQLSPRDQIQELEPSRAWHHKPSSPEFPFKKGGQGNHGGTASQTREKRGSTRPEGGLLWPRKGASHISAA